MWLNFLNFKKLHKNMEESKELTQSHVHKNIDMHQRKHLQDKIQNIPATATAVAGNGQIWLKNTVHRHHLSYSWQR